MQAAPPLGPHSVVRISLNAATPRQRRVPRRMGDLPERPVGFVWRVDPGRRDALSGPPPESEPSLHIGRRVKPSEFPCGAYSTAALGATTRACQSHTRALDQRGLRGARSP